MVLVRVVGFREPECVFLASCAVWRPRVQLGGGRRASFWSPGWVIWLSSPTPTHPSTHPLAPLL